MCTLLTSNLFKKRKNKRLRLRSTFFCVCVNKNLHKKKKKWLQLLFRIYYFHNTFSSFIFYFVLFKRYCSCRHFPFDNNNNKKKKNRLKKKIMYIAFSLFFFFFLFVESKKKKQNVCKSMNQDFTFMKLIFTVSITMKNDNKLNNNKI